MATNIIFRKIGENDTQICMDINRPLTSDSYKILYLVYDNCKEYTDLDISNKNYLRKVDFGEPKYCISRTYRAISNTRRDFFRYEYSREQEKRVKYHWLLKIAYITWFTNILMCILIPLFMYHDECLEGLLWAAHSIFGFYLVISYILEIIFFL